MDSLAEGLSQQREALQLEHQKLTADFERERGKLEERTARLDQLRKELEETSLKNIEVRLAAEEALAELTGELGEVRAQERVEEVRTIVPASCMSCGSRPTTTTRLPGWWRSLRSSLRTSHSDWIQNGRRSAGG